MRPRLVLSRPDDPQPFSQRVIVLRAREALRFTFAIHASFKKRFGRQRHQVGREEDVTSHEGIVP